jgi:hypothetical protein
VKNGSESGKDCGGSCSPCAAGLGCAAPADCQSGVCSGGVCKAPSCGDGVKNGLESDKDCGGAACSPCTSGLACGTSSDCVGGLCAGGHCTEPGCSDGKREGFASSSNIAACSGGWTVPGVATPASQMPACKRNSGDDNASNPSGSGCSVADLCAQGWHVCATSAEVAASSGAISCAAATFDAGTFFVTRQSGNGNAGCAAGGVNDLFGCGNVGNAANASCSPLTRTNGTGCSVTGAPWSCGAVAAGNLTEANTVTKSGAGKGGVLCCRDTNL